MKTYTIAFSRYEGLRPRASTYKNVTEKNLKFVTRSLEAINNCEILYVEEEPSEQTKAHLEALDNGMGF